MLPKNPILIENLHVDKIMISIRVSSIKKLIGYKDDDYKLKSLSIILPETNGYVNSYDNETMWMHFWLNFVKKL